ncbi:tripartite tricarboxylate transporter permease [Mameliella alba]|uniref:tripartite tricarboxylate transporter permease n=1 Tax=Mameliella alba TaxID=561184 RepID=UPI001C955895|nr:tripartite tricarboxylate transporter permease [Mameliella alba]MBY6120403.1 tripartite tricarboxylate transporter permease [Mameliella alba]
MIDGILIGLGTAFTPINLMLVMLGCFAGTFIGTLPGLGPITAISLMIPITYGLDPSSSLILMAGVYYGAIFGGSTSAILINAPGVASTVATSFDGYPLAQKGQAGKALAIAAYASFSGGTISAILLLVAAPSLAKLALSFQSPDYFALMLLGLTAVSAFATRGNTLKALFMAVLGLMLASVGQDASTAVARFTFGIPDLMDGLNLLLLAMATFALAEGLLVVLERRKDSADLSGVTSRLGSLKLSREEVREIAPTIGRQSVLGFVIGVLPGAGSTIASFLAYGTERNMASSEKQKEFGQGSIRGLAAPEAANNAACSGSFVPMLTLGIPGSGTTAIMLGALLSYGVSPGPRLFIDNPAVFWSVIISMYIGNFVLLILNLPMIPYISRLVSIPQRVLVPLILYFSIIGVYLVSFSTFDILLMIGIALAAIILRRLDYPMAPLILAFVLGGLMEENLRRSLMLNDGSISFLWQRPLTLAIMLATLAVLAIPLVRVVKTASGR